jgi:gliding motility associated protien GldN
MIHLKNISFSVLFFFTFICVKGQPGVFQPGDYRDGVYDKWSNMSGENRRLIPYTYLREGDVTWEKRVWRRLDLREKQNQQLYYPITIVSNRTSLLQVILKYVLAGQIVPFKDDDFLEPIELSVIRSKVVYQPTDSVPRQDYLPDGTEVTINVLPEADSTWLFENAQSLELKEDWFFDKQKSVLEVRILSLGINYLPKGKEDAGEMTLFYVYFPACRPFFAKHEVYNAKNDSERRTFEDIFWKRQFSSVAFKESNVYDRTVDRYAQGIDALLEADRIKGDIFKWEHDLWHF